MRHALLLTGLAVFTCNAAAVVLYKSYDANGRVTYSDQPPRGAVARVVPLEIDTSALPTAPAWRESLAQRAGASDVEELIRRRPAAPNDTAVRSAQARLEQARAALAAAQASSAPDDWIYFGAGRGRAPRPEYEARLDSLDSEVKAAEQQLADEERKLRLGY